jgi:hypothetical protein
VTHNDRCKLGTPHTRHCTVTLLLQEGQELELPTGFWVRPFTTVHPVPSQVSYTQPRQLGSPFATTCAQAGTYGSGACCCVSYASDATQTPGHFVAS